MNEQPKTSRKMETAMAIGEVVLTGVTLALRVAGLFSPRARV